MQKHGRGLDLYLGFGTSWNTGLIPFALLYPERGIVPPKILVFPYYRAIFHGRESDVPPNKEERPLNSIASIQSNTIDYIEEQIDGKKFRHMVKEIIGHGLTYHAVERSGLRIGILKNFVLRREHSSVTGSENSIHNEKVWGIRVLELQSTGIYKPIASSMGRNSRESLTSISRRIAPLLYEKDPRIGWRSLGPPCPLFDNEHFFGVAYRDKMNSKVHWWGGGIVGWVSDID
jgi:hypothetical protein